MEKIFNLGKDFFQIFKVRYSEGGTGEDWRIDPHLNLGNFGENNNKIWKKLEKIGFDPLLD